MTWFLFLFHRGDLILYPGGSSKFSASIVSSFFFRTSKFSRLYHREAPSNHCKVSILFASTFNSFMLSFLIWSSSWRLNMVVHQGFLSFSKCSIKILFGGAHIFFILHSDVQSLLPYLLRSCYVILDNLSLCFMIHILSGMRYFKPSFSLRSWDLFNWAISLLELSWVIFHLKPSLRNVAIVVLINNPSFLLFSRWKKFFISLVFLIKLIDSISGWSSPHNFGMFSLRPLEVISFVVDFPTTPFNPSS